MNHEEPRVDDARNQRFTLDDIGNARRLVSRHGPRIRYVPEAKSWLKWDGNRWRWCSAGEIIETAKETVESIAYEAELTDDPGEQEDVLKWAKKSRSLSKLKAMVSTASSVLSNTKKRGIPNIKALR